MTVPFLLMAAALATTDSYRTYALSHVLAAASLLWVARDLTSTGSLIGWKRAPHLSMMSLLIISLIWVRSRPAEFADLFGSEPLLSPEMLVFGAALGVLTLDDFNHRPARWTGLVGRVLLVGGGMAVGFAAMGAMFGCYEKQPTYSLGLGLAGTLLVAMAIFEGRLLWRGIELAQAANSN